MNVDLAWNWDNRLRTATSPINAGGHVAITTHTYRYAPQGYRVEAETAEDADGRDGANPPVTQAHRRYLVDPSGSYPMVLLEMLWDDANSEWDVTASYVHADGQTLCQFEGLMDGAGDDQPNYYLHDRLGSVRMVLDRDAVVQAAYTYDAFGNVLDPHEATGYDNPYRFANYGWDAAVGMYYCNARWYEPSLAVFTARDPVRGRFQEPRTLHAYLYCLNEPVNRVDPSGETPGLATGIVLSALVGAGFGAYTEMKAGGDASEIISAALTGATIAAVTTAVVGTIGMSNASLLMKMFATAVYVPGMVALEEAVDLTFNTLFNLVLGDPLPEPHFPWETMLLGPDNILKV